MVSSISVTVGVVSSVSVTVGVVSSIRVTVGVVSSIRVTDILIRVHVISNGQILPFMQ